MTLPTCARGPGGRVVVMRRREVHELRPGRDAAYFGDKLRQVPAVARLRLLAGHQGRGGRFRPVEMPADVVHAEMERHVRRCVLRDVLGNPAEGGLRCFFRHGPGRTGGVRFGNAGWLRLRACRCRPRSSGRIGPWRGGEARPRGPKRSPAREAGGVRTGYERHLRKNRDKRVSNEWARKLDRLTQSRLTSDTLGGIIPRHRGKEE